MDRAILGALRADLPSGLPQAVTVACEFGAVVGTADTTAPEVRGPWVPRTVVATLRALAEGPLSRLLEWDVKDCLATVEVRHDVARALGGRAADDALDEYQQLAEAVIAGSGCTARRATFAVDVVPDGLSKHDGTRAVLDRLTERPACVLVIGDSPSDIEMANEVAARLDGPITFAWVGAAAAPDAAAGIRVVKTDVAYALGTLEALEAFEQVARARGSR